MEESRRIANPGSTASEFRDDATKRAYLEKARRDPQHQDQYDAIRKLYLAHQISIMEAYRMEQRLLLRDENPRLTMGCLQEFYEEAIAVPFTRAATPGSSPSTPGTTSPSTLMWRERSSYLTNRDWLVLETGPASSSA